MTIMPLNRTCDGVLRWVGRRCPATCVHNVWILILKLWNLPSQSVLRVNPFNKLVAWSVGDDHNTPPHWLNYPRVSSFYLPHQVYSMNKRTDFFILFFISWSHTEHMARFRLWVDLWCRHHGPCQKWGPIHVSNLPRLRRGRFGCTSRLVQIELGGAILFHYIIILISWSIAVWFR